MHLFIALICFFASLTVRADLVDLFYYSGETGAYVSRGRTELISSENGFFFQYTKVEWNESVSFNMRNENMGNLRHISLSFDSGDANTRLSVGTYADATRYPFNDVYGGPGLNFSGDGRENNQLAGYFKVLEIQYGSLDELTAFAADFMQVGENGKAEFGSVRYNSSVPLTVPEPTSAALLVMSLMLLRPFMVQRKM